MTQNLTCFPFFFFFHLVKNFLQAFFLLLLFPWKKTMTREEKGPGARNRGVAQLSNEKLEKRGGWAQLVQKVYNETFKRTCIPSCVPSGGQEHRNVKGLIMRRGPGALEWTCSKKSCFRRSQCNSRCGQCLITFPRKFILVELVYLRTWQCIYPLPYLNRNSTCNRSRTGRDTFREIALTLFTKYFRFE